MAQESRARLGQACGHLGTLDPGNRNKVDFISVLSDPEIKSNCVICDRASKVNTVKNAVSVVCGENRAQCKKCLMSIAKRKFAMFYVTEYIERFNKKFFTVENVHKYIEDRFVHAELIAHNIANVVRDLVTTGVIGIYNKQYNGHRYVVKNVSMLKEPEIMAFVTLKGYGFKDGVKRVGNETG